MVQSVLAGVAFKSAPQAPSPFPDAAALPSPLESPRTEAVDAEVAAAFKRARSGDAVLGPPILHAGFPCLVRTEADTFWPAVVLPFPKWGSERPPPTGAAYFVKMVQVGTDAPGPVRCCPVLCGARGQWAVAVRGHATAGLPLVLFRVLCDASRPMQASSLVLLCVSGYPACLCAIACCPCRMRRDRQSPCADGCLAVTFWRLKRGTIQRCGVMQQGLAAVRAWAVAGRSAVGAPLGLHLPVTAHRRSSTSACASLASSHKPRQVRLRGGTRTGTFADSFLAVRDAMVGGRDMGCFHPAHVIPPPRPD